MIVVLFAAGWSVSEIAVLLHYEPATVRRWISHHQREGLDRPEHPAPPCPGTSPLVPAPPDRQIDPDYNHNHDQTCSDSRDRITALPAGSVVLAEDETHLDLLARVRACWMPTGPAPPACVAGLRRRPASQGAMVGRPPKPRLLSASQPAVTTPVVCELM